jgi:RHS repeat-associated protein
LISGSTVNWTIADPHGDLVGQLNTSGTVVSAYRYDPAGQTVATHTAGLSSPWRYQGALDISVGPDPLYDIGARLYSPWAGSWTSQDPSRAPLSTP